MRPIQHTTAASSTARWFDRLCLVAVFLACGYTMSPNFADADLWGHYQYGLDVLQSGALPRTATYTYTAAGFPWINHENLSELLIAGLVLVGGPLALVWGKFLLSLGLIGLIYFAARRDGVRWQVAAVVCGLVAANLSYHWSFRPQLASMACFAGLLALLQYAFSGWRGQWLWTSPRTWNRRDWTPGTCALQYSSRRLRALWLAIPLFALWANFHGGFLAGLLIYLVYLGCRGLEAICQRGQAGWGLVRRMALMGCGAVLACLLNPYGVEYVRWIIFDVAHPRPEISEWNSDALWTLVGAKFWLLLGVSAVAYRFSRRPLDLTEMVVLGLAVWQSLAHFRHGQFLVICLGFWLGPHLQGLLDRSWNRELATARPRWGWLLAPAVAIACLTALLTPRLTHLAVDPNQFPVAAIEYLHRQQWHGRMVVSFDWAQYALAALGTDPRVPAEQRTRVAMDGRLRTCYPQILIDGFFDFTYGPAANVPRNRFGGLEAIDPGWILEVGEPELALIARSGERSSRHMEQAGDRWTLLYQDGVAQIWGTTQRFADPASPDYLPPHERQITEHLYTTLVDWPALPAAVSSEHNHALARNGG